MRIENVVTNGNAACKIRIDWALLPGSHHRRCVYNQKVDGETTATTATTVNSEISEAYYRVTLPRYGL